MCTVQCARNLAFGHSHPHRFLRKKTKPAAGLGDLVSPTFNKSRPEAMFGVFSEPEANVQRPIRLNHLHQQTQNPASCLDSCADARDGSGRYARS
jgi:hypothetical protein